jgi:hypothetical protein
MAEFLQPLPLSCPFAINSPHPMVTCAHQNMPSIHAPQCRTLSLLPRQHRVVSWTPPPPPVLPRSGQQKHLRPRQRTHPTPLDLPNIPPRSTLSSFELAGAVSLQITDSFWPTVGEDSRTHSRDKTHRVFSLASLS